MTKDKWAVRLKADTNGGVWWWTLQVNDFPVALSAKTYSSRKSAGKAGWRIVTKLQRQWVGSRLKRLTQESRRAVRTKRG